MVDDYPPVDTDDGILAYLARRYPSRKYFSLERLSGGNVNHLWRILTAPASEDNTGDTAETASHTKMIVKHAGGVVRFNPSLELSTDRMEFEARVMRLVPTVMKDLPSVNVGVPYIYDYDPEVHVLCMTDGGGNTLKASYASLTHAQVHSIGERLAIWVARLHSNTSTTDIGPDGNPIARNIYRYSYRELAGALVKVGFGEHGREIGEAVNEKFGALLETDNDCVAHGDFWPGNMLVADGFDAAGAAEGEVPVTVVDWEITRRGVGVTDVAQFAAEAYLLDRYRDVDHGLAGVFVRKYAAERPPTGRFWQRFAIHWGMHIAFWPRAVQWAGPEETNRLGGLGVKVMEKALAMGDGLGDTEPLVDFIMGHFANAKQAL